MNILVISGSAREQSNSFGISQVIEGQLKKQGASVNIFDLRIEELPIFKMEESQYLNSSVAKLVKFAEQADAFFIITPEYHNGISGALKNSLDFLGIDHFKRKPVAIAAAQGGVVGGFNALNQLRLILRSLHAITLTDQVIVNMRHFDESQLLVDNDSIQQLGALVEELVAEVNMRLQRL
ncbi:NADPH-dependent FMN reductase [Bacillus sp. AK128]